MLLLLTACSTPPKQHTYLKYSGYIDGCVDATLHMAVLLHPQVNNVNQLDPVWYESMCMDFYLNKLDKENIKPKDIDKHIDRNEQI